MSVATSSTRYQFTRLKFAGDVSLGKTFQGHQKAANELFVEYVRAASIQPSGMVLDDQRMWMTPEELARFSLRRGDVLIVEGGAGYGRSVVLDSDMPGWGFQNHVIRIRPSDGWSGRFLNWAIKAQFAAGLIDVLVAGATIPTLSSDKAREIPVPHIAPSDQQRIADFLDRETAEIDAMDVELDRLVETLNERRAVEIESVLSNTGLPAKLGYFVDTLAGFAFPAKDFTKDERDVRLMRGVNVKPQMADWTEAVYWPTHLAAGLERYELDAGDVILGMDRPFISSGTRVLQVGPADLPALLLQRVLRLRPIQGGSSEFVMLVLMTRAFQDYATPETTGISVPHISEGQVLDFKVPVPSAQEQHALAREILEQTARIDSMIADAQRLKALLAERRTTLITDVVTGRKEV